MRLLELFTEHATRAAGCFIVAESTKRFLLGLRSKTSSQPGTWNILGGKAKLGETPIMTARREVREESGILVPRELTPLFVFRSPEFVYHNFLASIPDEVTPRIDDEHEDFSWCEVDEWPQPLHFGVRALLRDRESRSIIKDALERHAA